MQENSCKIEFIIIAVVFQGEGNEKNTAFDTFAFCLYALRAIDAGHLYHWGHICRL